MEDFVEFEDELFAIEIGLLKRRRIAFGGWSKPAERGEVIAIKILDDVRRLITVEISVADQDVFLRADGFFEVEGDDALLWISGDRCDCLLAFVCADEEARRFGD